MPSPKPFLSSLALSLAILNPLSGWGMPDDREQPISIQADRAEQRSLNDGETTEYFGNVLMSQGTLAISGDQVTIYSKNRGVTRIIAIGNPAQLQQQTDAGKMPLTAQAQRIEYDLHQESVVLLEKASIRQNDATVNSQRIYYNMATRQVKANGTSDGSSRVQMVLTPSRSASDDDTPIQPTTDEAGNASTNSQ